MVLDKEKSHPMLTHGSGGFLVLADSGRCYLGDGLDSITIPDSNMILDSLQDEVSSKFEPKKIASGVLSEVYSELDMQLRAGRVGDCGSYLEYYVTDQEKKLHTANFCKDRLCPMCNWRRSLKIFGQVSQIMNYLEQSGGRGSSGYRFLFLTLTVKNCSAEELPNTVDKLFEGWRFLYNKNRLFKKIVCGTFRSLEVTRNKKTGEFHPHFHVILAVHPGYFDGKNYLTQSRWADLWRSSCGLDYEPVVDVRTIKNGSGGVSGAVAEVSKYAVKSADFLNGSMDEKLSYVASFLAALSRRRLCDTTGCFRDARKALHLDDMETGDLVHVDGKDIRSDIVELIVRYHWRHGCYVRI